MFLKDDDMVECPYNQTHCMLRKRLQSHLLKCRVNYPDVELRKCPFNITHLIPEPEFTHHATNCPDRKLITQYKYDAPVQKQEEGPKHAPVECDEDWDDTDVNDYNPRLYLDKANIIRKPDGANRSERKLFIKKERKRLGDGDDSSDEDEKGCGSSISKRQRADDEDCAVPRSYNKESCDRINQHSHSKSPSTSSYSIERSHLNKYKRNASRTFDDFKRSDKSHSSNRPNLQEAPHIGGNEYISFSHSYNRSDSHAYNDRDTDTNTTMPPAPPPPMISYPAPRSYFSKKPSSG